MRSKKDVFVQKKWNGATKCARKSAPHNITYESLVPYGDLSRTRSGTTIRDARLYLKLDTRARGWDETEDRLFFHRRVRICKQQEKKRKRETVFEVLRSLDENMGNMTDGEYLDTVNDLKREYDKLDESSSSSSS